MAKFDFKKKYLIIYLCLIVFDAFLMLCRWLEHIVPNVRLLPDFLLDHITNFALCMLLLLIFGITVLSFGGKFRGITAVALVTSVLNIGMSVLFQYGIPPTFWTPCSALSALQSHTFF